MRFDCSHPDDRAAGIDAATAAIAAGDLVVLPTDTVSGLAADAFSADAVHRLVTAKGRGRETPPPVLIGAPATLEALAEVRPQDRHALASIKGIGPAKVEKYAEELLDVLLR